MWYLIFMSVMFNPISGYNEPVIEGWYEYETLNECFWAREKVATVLQKGDGKQAICIWKEDT